MSPAAGRPLVRRLVEGGAWVFAGKVFTVSFSLLTNALLSRLLEPAEFGSYILAFSIVTAGSIAIPLGQQIAVVRLVAQATELGRPDRARAVIRLVYRHTLLGAVVVGAVLLLGGGALLAEGLFDSPLLSASMGVVVAWMTVQSFTNLTSETFRSLHDLRLASLFGGVVGGALTVATLAVLLFTEGSVSLQTALIVSVLGGLASLCLSLTVLRFKAAALGPAAKVRSQEVLSVAGPMWITGMTGFALRQSDVWIVGAFRAAEEVAVYGAALRLVNLVVMPLMLINLIVPPTVAQLHAAGEHARLERLLRNVATIGGVPAFAVLGAFLLAGAPIMGLVYGDYYRDGALVLAVLSFGRLITVVLGPCGVALNMTGHQTALMRITGVASVLTVAASLVAVRYWGALGVALSACGGGIFQSVASWAAARRLAGLSTHVGAPRIRDLMALFGKPS